MSTAVVILTPSTKKHAEEESANMEILPQFAAKLVYLLQRNCFSPPPIENGHIFAVFLGVRTAEEASLGWIFTKSLQRRKIHGGGGCGSQPSGVSWFLKRGSHGSPKHLDL